MLLFSSETFTVDGITVFPDHADPNQFWYLPGPVGLAKLPDTGEPQFLLTMFDEDVASSGVQGVGFLNVTMALVPSDDTKSKLMGQIRTQFPDASDPRLAPVSFDEGTVQIVTLDLQGGGGTSAAPAAPGTFQAVQNILGATTPELFGDNNALFGLKLTEAGASILEAAFDDNMTPVGCIYNMKFTGVSPSLDVKITADLKRVYSSFSVGLEAKVYFASAGIDATFEKLRQDGSIKVEVVDLSTSASVQQKEDWALNLFKDQIMSQWFVPSLSPTTAQAANVTMPALSSLGGGSPTAAKPVTAASSGSSLATAAGATASSLHVPTPPVASPVAAVAAQKAPVTTSGLSVPSVGAAPAAAASGATGVSAPATVGAATPTTPAATPPAATTPAKPTPTPAGAPAKPTPPPAGAAANPLTSALNTASNAASAASPFGVSLQLKFVSQDELKTVEIEYNRMDAVQRTYAPQGYFGLALQGLDKSKHFLKVDGSDPFFQRFVVTTNPPKDFAGIGLLTAHAALDYGDPAGPQPPKHGEVLYDGTSTVSQTWPVFEGLIQETSYTYTEDYKFDPESGWVGEQNAYTLPPVKTDNRLLNLDPHDFLGFLNIVVSAGRIDPNLVDHIDVAFQYTGTSGWQTSTTITLQPGSKPQNWKLRLSDKKSSTYTYSTVCYLKDGTSFPRGPYTSSASAVVVSDPFTAAINISVQPAFDPTAYKLGIVELQYADADNGYSFQTSLEILNTATNPTPVRLPLLNPKLNQFQYRVTLLGLTGQKTQGNYITASDPLVLVTV